MKLFLFILGLICGVGFCQFQVINHQNKLKDIDTKQEQHTFNSWLDDCSASNPCSITVIK